MSEDVLTRYRNWKGPKCATGSDYTPAHIVPAFDNLVEEMAEELAKAQAACEEKDVVLRAVLEVSPDFSADENGHYSLLVRSALGQTATLLLKRLEAYRKALVEIERLDAWFIPVAHINKIARAALEKGGER